MLLVINDDTIILEFEPIEIIKTHPSSRPVSCIWIYCCGTIHTQNLVCRNPHLRNPRIEFKIISQFFKTHGESFVRC